MKSALRRAALLTIALCLPLPALQTFSADQLPADVVDLKRWKLTLPIAADGKQTAREVSASALEQFSDANCFFVHRDKDGIVLRAPCGGATTKGSQYPRCELREMQEDGSKPAAWSTSDPQVRELRARMAVTQTPPIKKHVVCAQIHDADDDLLMIRLEGKKLFVERGSHGDVMLSENYQLGDPFDLAIQASSGIVRIFFNGREKLRWEVKRDGCYFKAGCYTQSNPARGDTPDSYGEVIIYKLRL